MGKIAKIIFLVNVVIFGLFLFTEEKSYAYGCPTDGSASTYEVDNDSLISGANSKIGTWSYVSVSSSRNGDHRYSSSTYAGDYFWKLGPCVDWRAYAVYLNSAAFTDPQAAYYLRSSADPATASTFFMGTLNQYSAPAGWNYIGAMVSSGTASSYPWLDVLSYYHATGADAAKMVTY
jgi:hypothetical protein